MECTSIRTATDASGRSGLYSPQSPSWKGLILTTGGFTEAAQREATRDGAKPIDLIDGKLLAMRMKEVGLGVNTSIETTETEVVQVNTDWFKSFE